MFRWVVILVILAIFVIPTSYACDSAGPNVHVGKITAVDSDTSTFTLLDAETGSPIKFAASSKLLLGLAGLRRTIAVDYQEEEGHLVALNIR